MANRIVTRTYKASICNQSQVRPDLDSLAFAASKLWNVGRWHIQRVWDAIGHIPGHNGLTSYLKRHERYKDLHSQSSQRVLQELAEAFNGWYASNDADDNPPGYRKQGDEHPRSTVTFKQRGFRLDAEHGYVRLSKGQNLKEHRSDFVLCSYEIRPDVDLAAVESVQQVRAVWNGDDWELHFVCNVGIEQADAPGEKTAGIDLGISNVAAVSIGDETLLYPGNAVKEDVHYFRQVEYGTEGEDGPSKKAEWARQKKQRRRKHSLHALTRDIVEQCVDLGVGEIAVGHPKDIRDDAEWGRHGNKKIHDWPFDTIIDMIEYKAGERGINVQRVDEAGLRSSKTCCACGMEASGNRVERGLYVCDECGLVANADLNAAENMRATVTPSPAKDRSNGCLAQPAVRLFDKHTGVVAGREQVADCKP
jgi:putative transposase